MSKIKKDKLVLLEKLIQSSSEGEITTEQKDLFVNLVKETSPKSPKMGKKNANSSDRQSRQRVKYVKNKSHEVEDKNHGKVQIPLPQNDDRQRTVSSNSRSDSGSSFWSSGSRDRVKNRKTSSRSHSRSSRSYSSRSRSRSHSRSSSRSRSGSSSASHSTSRSRSRSSSYSRNKRMDRSKSPQTKKEPMSGSLSSVQSAPAKPYRPARIIRDTASDIGRNDKIKRKKLNKRSEIKKSRSLDINPDIFIEERIKQKYKELHNLLSSQFSDSQAQMTKHQFQQMQNLRTQYVSASHGLPPSGVLVPRSLPASMRVKRGAPQGLTSMKSKSRETLISDFGEDHTFVSVQRVLNTTAAREGKVIVDPHPVSIKKKKGKKKSDSNSKLNSTIDNSSDHTGSRTLSPRSRSNGPELHHLKDSDNPKMLKWLKEKDKEHRKKEREERKKRREEREKLVLEANEKFERRLESQKHVEKWKAEKEKEYRQMMKRRKNEEKEMFMQTKPKMELNLPGKSMTVRPQSAPKEWVRKSESGSTKTKGKTGNNRGSTREALTVQDQLGTSSEHLKFDLNDTNKSQDQLPPTSKFMYKRPVAGKIKLNMRNRPMSAQPKLQTTNTEKPTNSQPSREAHQGNMRMSYDDWINTKRKQDQDKRKQEKIRQKEELSKSDPDMARIVPDVAKKRIHTIMNERKSIDTGIKRYDAAVNGSFGGGSFDGSKSPTTPTKTHPYKLDDNRPATAKDRTVESLKVAGKSYQRPGTAPSGGRKVPIPTRSPYSPVPAHHPANVEEIMNSEDQSNPFKLPFPPEEGVPKHVAARQKKIFGEQNFQKNERPEPKGSDSTLDIVPSASAVEVKINTPEDVEYDNITAMDTSKNRKDDENRDYTTNEVVNEVKENKLNDKEEKNKKKEPYSEEKSENNANENKQGEKDNDELIQNMNSDKEEKSEEKNKTVLENKSNENEQTSETSETSLSEDLDEQKSDNSNEQKGQDEVDSKKEEQKNEEDGTSLSQSIKHVSFCEEPEVFVDNEVGQVWSSTDTGTPDEDNSRYTTKEDLSTLIDHCGKLLNDEYGDQNGEDDKTFLTESLDEDF